MNSLFFVDGHEFGFVCFPYTKEQRERIEARFDFAEEVTFVVIKVA